MNTTWDQPQGDLVHRMREEGGLLISLGVGAMLVAGLFHGEPGPLRVAGMVLLLLTAVALGWERLQHVPVDGPAYSGAQASTTSFEPALSVKAWWKARRDAGLSALWLVTAYAFIQMAGSLGAEVYPLLYALLAVLATCQLPVVTLSLVGFALTLEALCFVTGHSPGLTGASTDALVVVTRALFLGLFGGLHLALTYGELVRQRRHHAQALNQDRLARLEAAQAWRLVATGRPDASKVPREEAEELLAIDAIDAIESSINATLRLLRASLDGHSAVLLWLDDAGLRLDIRGADARRMHTLAQTLQPGEGALAGILRRGEKVRLKDLSASYQGLSYYVRGGSQAVRQFVGVPVMERKRLRGVLCVDRTSGQPFTGDDEEVLERAAASIMRAIQTERIFLTMERSRDELGQFYEASRRLNQALTPGEVYDVALGSLQRIGHHDFAAIVLSEREGESGKGRLRHRLIRVVASSPKVSRWASKLSGEVFGHNTGLVSMAVEMRVSLPHNGAYREAQNVVFTRSTPLEGMRSLLILPLVVHDEAIGALVLAAAQDQAFSQARRDLLQVVANQVSVSLQNARMYEAMETMATIDGLTGLSNHRTFKHQLDDVIARSERGAGEFTLLLTDIDHFKSINDTYGHPVGDEVLRQVSRAFQELLRQTDLPARYGGEEFVVILEGTDLDGAVQIAERLRQAVAALTFTSAQREFSISMSFGLSSYPTDAEDKATLIETADQALYYAKTHGRNQVRMWRDVRHATDRG